MLVSLGLVSGGCATYHAYDGPRRPADKVAIVSGTAKLRAATPLALVIRAVDDRPVDVRYSSVALTPGRHRLLVDCQLGEQPGAASRHSIDIDVGAGERYRLTAEMRPGNRACARIDLEPE
jgi:chorismate synthase